MLIRTAGDGIIELLIGSDGNDVVVGLCDDAGEALAPLDGVVVASATGGDVDRNAGDKSIPSDASVVLGVLVRNVVFLIQ